MHVCVIILTEAFELRTPMICLCAVGARKARPVRPVCRSVSFLCQAPGDGRNAKHAGSSSTRDSNY